MYSLYLYSKLEEWFIRVKSVPPSKIKDFRVRFVGTNTGVVLRFASQAKESGLYVQEDFVNTGRDIKNFSLGLKTERSF